MLNYLLNVVDAKAAPPQRRHFPNARFYKRHILEGQILLFDAIEVTLYGGFGNSDFSGYGLPRSSA